MVQCNARCRDSILYRLVLAYFTAHDNWASQHNITIMCRVIPHIMRSFPAITRQTQDTFPHLRNAFPRLRIFAFHRASSCSRASSRFTTHLHVPLCIFTFHRTSSQEHPSIVQPVPWCVAFCLLLYLTMSGIVRLLFRYGPLHYIIYLLRALPIRFRALGRRLCAT
jgi:hypothetical protein